MVILSACVFVCLCLFYACHCLLPCLCLSICVSMCHRFSVCLCLLPCLCVSCVCVPLYLPLSVSLFPWLSLFKCLSLSLFLSIFREYAYVFLSVTCFPHGIPALSLLQSWVMVMAALVAMAGMVLLTRQVSSQPARRSSR